MAVLNETRPEAPSLHGVHSLWVLMMACIDNGHSYSSSNRDCSLWRSLSCFHSDGVMPMSNVITHLVLVLLQSIHAILPVRATMWRQAYVE